MKFSTRQNSSDQPNSVTNRRSFLKSITAASLGLVAGGAAFRANTASAGQVGYIAVQGAELFAAPDYLSPLLYMDEGVPVDVLFGPYYGLYEVRYYGTDGWIRAEYLSINGYIASSDIDGAPGAPSAYGGSSQEVAVAEPVAAAYEGEQWIDINRSSGLVSLMIGDTAIASFWASLGWDTTDSGFYATAIGTYYVYEFRKHLHFTDYAKNYISHWVGFDPARYNGFHSYTKNSKGEVVPNGAGRTAGCVAMNDNDCEQLWDFAWMGMRVEVHW